MTTTVDSGGPAGGIDLDRPIALHALTFLDEGDDVTVGRQDTDSYCVLPADGAFLLRELAQGVSPRSVALNYQAAYGESVDILEFLAAMDELGFIAGAGEAAPNPVPIRWQKLGRALFSPFAGLAYLGLLLAASVAMIRHHELIPRYQNLFFTDYITIIILALFVGQVPCLLFHESFHMFAGRRLGLRSQLGISRRLYFVVFETTMDGLVTVPRRKRYLPILAGMLADLITFAALTMVAALVQWPDGSDPLLGRICLAFAFATVLRFAWQFYFYLQTDLYHVAVTVFGCVDLQNTARIMLLNRANRLLRRRNRLRDESIFHPTDRAVARWYSWLLLAGYTFSILITLFAGIPTTIHIFRTVLTRFTDHGSSSAGLSDSIGFIVVNVLQFAIMGFVLLRSRRGRRARKTSHLTDLEYQ